MNNKKEKKIKYPTAWAMGKPRGSVQVQKGGVMVKMTDPDDSTKQMATYFAYSKYGDKAKEMAEEHCKKESDKYGYTRNQIRYLDANTIEVKLTLDQTMKTDAKNLDKVEMYPLHAKKKKYKETERYYVVYQCENDKGQKKAVHNFTDLVCDYGVVDYVNGNSLDLRECNLQEFGKDNREQGTKCPMRETKKANFKAKRDNSKPESEETKTPDGTIVKSKESTNSIKDDDSEDSDDEQVREAVERLEQRESCERTESESETSDKHKQKRAYVWRDPNRSTNRCANMFTQFSADIKKKGGSCVSTKDDYVDAHTKLKVKCADSHEFEICKNNLDKGRWCPFCTDYLCEQVAVLSVSHLLDKPFKKVRPDWLKTKAGGNLELDGYNEELKIGIEYSGIQHYQFVKHFHRKDADFEKQKERDELKRKLCADNDVDLIEVPYTVAPKEMPEYIAQKLKNLGHNVDARKDTLDLTELSRVASKTEKYKELVESKQGTLLEGLFVTQFSKCTVECDKGHQWTTNFKNLKRGFWCDVCAHQRSDSTKQKISDTLKKTLSTQEGKQKKQASFAKRSETMAQIKQEVRTNLTEKVCSCKDCARKDEPQPLDNFGKKKDTKDGYQPYCKKCVSTAKQRSKAKAKSRPAPAST